jgi:hypothetical protein
MDHLDGFLFLDRLVSRKTDLFRFTLRYRRFCGEQWFANRKRV